MILEVMGGDALSSESLRPKWWSLDFQKGSAGSSGEIGKDMKGTCHGQGMFFQPPVNCSAAWSMLKTWVLGPISRLPRSPKTVVDLV